MRPRPPRTRGSRFAGTGKPRDEVLVPQRELPVAEQRGNVVPQRVRQHGDQPSLLVERERGRPHPVVPGRGGRDAEGAPPPLDHVEVQLEDARLREHQVHADRGDRLEVLAEVGLPGREEEVAGELLGDGAAAVESVADVPVDEVRVADRAEADARVGPEVPVLETHDHVAGRPGDLAERREADGRGGHARRGAAPEHERGAAGILLQQDEAREQHDHDEDHVAEDEAGEGEPGELAGRPCGPHALADPRRAPAQPIGETGHERHRGRM